MTDDHQSDGDPGEQDPARAATQQRPPERELELRLKKNPASDDAKVDVGSDESMDASDPVSVTAPGGGEPAPSSTYPKEE